jgi:hypothetical protein
MHPRVIIILLSPKLCTATVASGVPETPAPLRSRDKHYSAAVGFSKLFRHRRIAQVTFWPQAAFQEVQILRTFKRVFVSGLIQATSGSDYEYANSAEP